MPKSRASWFIFVVMATAFFLPRPCFSFSSATPAPQKADDRWAAASALVTAFITKQMVPNATVPNPPGFRAGLVLSYLYSPSEKDYRYKFSKTATYDNAAAVIALTMAGERKAATTILDAMVRNARPNGDLWFIMNTHNEWPSEADADGAVVRIGSSSWAGYATTFYILAELLRNPSALRDNPKLQAYLRFAERVGKTVIERQVRDPARPGFGMVTGGDGMVLLQIGGNTATEVLRPGRIGWISVEHNIDSYFFLRDLAFLTGDELYRTAADQIRSGLLKEFNHETRQLNRGVGEDGSDPIKALDCASWGALFLLAADQPDLAHIAIQTTREYECTIGELVGYKPFIDITVYEGQDAQTHYFPDRPDTRWNDIAMIWSEGSLGVAIALTRTGQRQKAEKIIHAMLHPEMHHDGGIRYATRELEHQFTSSYSTIGSAWAVMAIHGLEGDPLGELFWCAKPPNIQFDPRGDTKGK